MWLTALLCQWYSASHSARSPPICTSVAAVLCVTPNEVVSGGGDVTCVSIVCTSVAAVLCVTPNEVFSCGGDVTCVVSTVEIKCVLSVWGTEIFVVGWGCLVVGVIVVSS